MRETVLSKTDIENIISKLANELTKDFANTAKTPVFVDVLKGATPFFSDLTKACKFKLFVDYIKVSSYSGASSTGVVHLDKDISLDIQDRDVIIVEDIIDTGLTLSYLKEYFMRRYKARSIKVCCLIDKKPYRKVDFAPDYVGWTTDGNQFLVGYGLDYNEYFRNEDYIFIPDKEEIAECDKDKAKTNH